MLVPDDMSDNDSDDMSRDVARVHVVLNSNPDADPNVIMRDNMSPLNEVSHDLIAGVISEASSGSSPIIGESFCECLPSQNGKITCSCGEEDSYHEWHWDYSHKSRATKIQVNKKEVFFHVEYSCGTAAIRGNKPMENKQFYWEIRMMTPVYGTDMMVGVGTSHVNFNRHRYSFVSLLGSDAESWGLSYTGKVYHKGQSRQFAPQFGQGSIIGIHLDMWNGTLSFFKNRKPLGVAYTGLQGKILYPMVSSTAARSGMKVIRSRSFDSSLQFMCCCKLRELIPNEMSVLDVVTLPPGLKAFLDNNLSWLLGQSPRNSSTADDESESSSRRKRPHSTSPVQNDDEGPSSKHFRHLM